MGIKIFKLFYLMLFPGILWAQKIDHTVSFRDINNDYYFRVNYDNDYFAASDKNYTQGYSLELVIPELKKNPVNYLFVKPYGSLIRYGISFEHIGYTPKRYISKEIQFGDRPFAAAAMLRSFSIATDTNKHTRLSQSFSMGVIGPAAGGEEIQVGIHRAINDKIPRGWHHQIRNDVVLNYRLDFEKRLLRIRNMFVLQSNSILQLGSLFTNVSTGVNASLGLIDSPFSNQRNRRGFKIYLFAQPLINAIGYDATLQGGMLNKESVYAIPGDEVERLTGQLSYGLVIKSKKLFFEYTRTMITREFKSGRSAGWGGVKVGFVF